MGEKGKSEEKEKTFTKSTGFSAFGKGSHAASVDVKDGKIVRIRPLHFDSKYTQEEIQPWKIEARGKVLEPYMKSLITPFGAGFKKRIYSPNRILYPLKRVDWDPNGERNPENRGKSKYVRISWDEAVDLIVSEIKRVIKEYGPEGILGQVDGHGETKVVHATHGCAVRLLELLGGYTLQVRNPDSWEGWYWGAKHVWGMEPVGLMSPHQTNLFPDISKHTDLLLFWGCDPETTPWGFAGGQMASRIAYWFTELGIKCIYICPDLNYGAAVHADKWIPIRPNTDAAMQLAIAYTWITEGTYDKEYVATHTVGYDKFEEYVLGKEDGIAKTPKWAAERTGVPSRIIKELAREWASKTTTIVHGLGGPYIRGAYSHEPARLEVILLGMQGLGKPGAHQLQMIEGSFISALALNIPSIPPPMPGGVVMADIMAAYRGYEPYMPMPKQVIPKTLIHEAILNPPLKFTGSSLQSSPTEEQFVKYTYPAEGCSEIHMIWTDTPCLITCWNDGNYVTEAYRSPKIEFFLAMHPWMENDCLFADLILPSTTKYEDEDIGDDGVSYQVNTIFYEGKCIEPIGEAKSNFEIVSMIAEKLGLLEEFTKGKTVQDWIRLGFETSGVAELVSWEKLKEKGYFPIPTDPDWERHRAGMIDFYEDPENNPLRTPSGKLEFYSERLAKHFPDDDERPPSPRWIPYGKSHQESLLHPRSKRYPLLVVSNHPRWRVHAQLDDVTWLREIETCKIRGMDGYLYEPLWIHPEDAEKRDIKKGDIVQVYNERGIVLGGAYVMERIMPGVVYMDHGARYDPIVPGKLDRGGAINTITPRKITSPNAAGMVTNGFLVEVERADLGELMKKYPEHFKRIDDKAAGLRFERVLEGGK